MHCSGDTVLKEIDLIVSMIFCTQIATKQPNCFSIPILHSLVNLSQKCHAAGMPRYK